MYKWAFREDQSCQGGFYGTSPHELRGKDQVDPGSILGSGRFLDKEMATHSSILVWRILWTEEPGKPQSMGLKRVRHD